MPRISPVEAGRIGGRSRSQAKLDACRRNGFQRTTSVPAEPPAPTGPFSRWQGTIDGKQTSEYHAFNNARTRCTNPNNPNWPLYGGRGIEFRFASFDEFMDALGPKPTPEHQLDRINNDSHYEPGNVRWATPQENTNNRRCSAKPIPLQRAPLELLMEQEQA